MIKPAYLHKMIHEYELVPQAIIAEPVDALAKRVGSKLEKGQDDLDEYQGAAAWLDGLPFAVMHYRGHPENLSTIYLPFDIREVDKITEIISRITAELKVPPSLIKWQRKDDPEL
jgi:hypothetical protein